jgi:glycerol-3-phosphate acyltransferase PlsY
MLDISAIIIAYLLGSIASAIIVCKVMGLDDPRLEGSGNPGATNVLRLHGKNVAIITLFGDVLKGIFAVLLARIMVTADIYLALSTLAVFLGHLYPVFFRFQGGKGVATYIGILFALDWQLGLAFAVTWLCAAVLFRYSSLAALIAAFLTPLYTYLLLPSLTFALCALLMTTLLFWRHRSNIRNLMDGNENKLGAKKSA